MCGFGFAMLVRECRAERVDLYAEAGGLSGNQRAGHRMPHQSAVAKDAPATDCTQPYNRV